MIFFLISMKIVAIVPRFPMRHSHLAVIQQHAVHLLDGSIGGVLSLEVDEGVALGAVLITHHLEQRRTRG